MTRSRLVSAAFLAALLAPTAARAEVEVSVFGGEHSFAAHNSLGRNGSTSYGSSLVDSPSLGARFTYLPHPRFGADLEVATAPTANHNGDGVNVPSARVNGIVNLLTGRIRPFFLVGCGVLVSSPADSVHESTDAHVAGVAGAGIRVDVGDWWGLRADGRVFAMPATAGSDVAIDREWSIGIYGRFPAPPPPEIRGRENEIIADRDSDGVGDRLDRCPDVQGPVRNYGCPVEEIVDHDGDGVVDTEDRCPKEPGPKSNHGCPVPPPPPPVAAPPPPPPPPPPIVPIKDVDAIAFDRGRNTLTPASHAILDAAAEVLKEHPEANVEIVGHTDASGNETSNLRLSRERAETVRTYLVAHGIKAARITAVGKGSEEPVTSGTSEEDRMKNRRVEFRFSAAPPP